MALLDSRDGSRIAGAILCISQEPGPLIEADGLLGVGELASGVAQFGVALGHVGALRSAAELGDNRVVGCASEEPLGESRLIKFRASDPGSHDLGQSCRDARVTLRFPAPPQRRWKRRDRAVGDCVDALAEPSTREEAAASVRAGAVAEPSMFLPTLILPTHRTFVP
ncbi:MAG: hypothetical protein J0H14_04875 [Alphaproteobacteria bacterium]|nr:hypothetical protein [Alphaproteobacteria bacterium]